MIERLQRIASHLTRFRPLIVLGGLLGAALFGLSAINPAWIDGARYLGPSALVTGWMLTLYAFAALLSRVPARAAPGAGWWDRIKIAIRRGLVWLLGMLMVILTLTMVVLSYQMLRIWAV